MARDRYYDPEQTGWWRDMVRRHLLEDRGHGRNVADIRNMRELEPVHFPLERPMSLDDAIDIILSMHTRDDDTAGFTLELGTPPRHFSEYDFRGADYLRAWRTLWRYRELRRYG